MANGTISYRDKMFDRNHAAKIFVANNYGLSPKYGWLFHVSFEINPEISRVSNDDLLRMGFVVKSASLPKFTVETKTFNAYNRVDIVQSKMKYDTVTIKFHDDNLDVIRNFWYDYYSYYYRDADWNPNIYQAASKYNERQNQSWGFTPRQYPTSSPATQQYLPSIKIYSLHNKRFAEYTLINPVITSFKHGEHSQGGDAGTLENEMTVQFQAVKYQYGDVNPDTVSGFATLQYDLRPSPLGTSNNSSTAIHDLSEGATGLPGIANNLKNLNGKAILGSVLSAAGTSLVTGALNGALNGTLGSKLSAVAGAASDLLGTAKAKIGSVFSNGDPVDGEGDWGNISQDGLPGNPSEQQAEIDNLNSNNSVLQSSIDDSKAQLDELSSQADQLQAQIDADQEQLLNPDLSSEDIAALNTLIAENSSQLSDVIDNMTTLQTQINDMTSAIDENNARIAELQTAMNPSGNSEEDGGYGAGSVTQTFDDGSSITTNPDGSTTTIDSDGNIYTTPQANPVDNPDASSNQLGANDQSYDAFGNPIYGSNYYV